MTPQEWVSYVCLGKTGAVLPEKTVEKFSFDLDAYIQADNMGVLNTGVFPMSISLGEFIIKNPKTQQVDREQTIEFFTKQLDEWLKGRQEQAEKYRQAVLAVFKRYKSPRIGAGMLADYAIYEAGLLNNVENMQLIEDTIDYMLDDGTLLRFGTKGKGAGIQLSQIKKGSEMPLEEEEETKEEETEEETTEEEVEEEPEPPVAPIPIAKKRAK